jgi:hypothetical protein
MGRNESSRLSGFSLAVGDKRAQVRPRPLLNRREGSVDLTGAR